jgi:hypothetical protein
MHVDSRNNALVALVDFIAGVAREEFEHNNKFLSSVIADKVIFKKEIIWNDLKRKWIDKIENK